MSELIREFIVNDPPFGSCHASTLINVDGGYLVCWFAGSAEGKDDVRIWLARRQNNKWCLPRQLPLAKPAPHWNPVLFSNNGMIYLFFKVGKEIPTWTTWIMSSRDEGNTWTEPAELVPGDQGGRGPVKNKPIALSDGSWVAPGSIENEWWEAFVDISRDNGATWHQRMVPLDKTIFFGCKAPEKMPQNHGVIQPALWESTPGHVHMLLRSSCGYICRSDSEDYGGTWSPAYKTELPNNNSGIDLVKGSNGEIALVYNPVGGNWLPRSPLSLIFSHDNGESWEDRVDIETEFGEFLYPSIIFSSGEYALTYTWNRNNIVFMKGDRAGFRKYKNQ